MYIFYAYFIFKCKYIVNILYSNKYILNIFRFLMYVFYNFILSYINKQNISNVCCT